MKLSLAMIVKGSDKEGILLDRCLHYASQAVDSIYITITHLPGEKRNETVEGVCKKYNAIISDFEWTKDFAAARNFNFSQVESDYIFWLDADDVLKDEGFKEDDLGSRLKATVESKPEVDAFSMFYLYAFDEHKNAVVVHQKTRVIKNGCCKWQGLGLHEELVPTRELNTFAIKGIDIVHMSDEERLTDSRKRNYDIAINWITKDPSDPTAYFNAGNAAFGVGLLDEALGYFETFLKTSKSDDEKYIIRLRKADVFQAQGKFNEALEEARYAIGLKPEYPDAYHSAGKLFFLLSQFEKAKEMFLNGLGRPAPYYQIIVYNPREYDYQPLMNLAKTYYALNLPQLALPCLEAAVQIVPADKALQETIEILRKESKEGDEIVKLASKLRKVTDKKKLLSQLEKVPPKYKFHPEILRIRNTNFIKEESSGKDLVIFCGYTAEEWTPESIAKKGSGGSEEAAITMAQGLASKGWNVTVYNNCGTEEKTFFQHLLIKADVENYKKAYCTVTYKPYMAWNYRDKQDVTILWRNTKPLDWNINSTQVYVDMHDVIPAGEFTDTRIDNLDKVFFKSNYHRNLYPQIPDEKTIIIPNGIHSAVFSLAVEKDPNLIINTSSPVRALSALIPIMKEVRKSVPDAKMQWAYGWETTDLGMANEPKYLEWKTKTQAGMKEAGIEELGRLNHTEVAKLYQKASIFAYPTSFPEIDCISLTKAYASGCYPVCTDFAALGEKMTDFGSFFHDEEDIKDWDMAVQSPELQSKIAKEIIKALEHPPTSEQRLKVLQETIKTYNWDSVISKWDKELCSLTTSIQ